MKSIQIWQAEPGCYDKTEALFKQLIDSKLQTDADKKAAEIMRGVIANKWDDEFMEVAASGASFLARFGGGDNDDADDDVVTLVSKLRDFKLSLKDNPIQVDDRERSDSFITGDMDSEVTVKLHKQVTGSRRKDIVFHVIPDFKKDIWRKGGDVTKIYQKSKFLSATGEAGKSNSLLMINAETFPNQVTFKNANAPKQLPQLSDDMKAAAQWCLNARLPNSIVLFFDGRNRKIGRAFETIVEGAQLDELKHVYGNITYGMPDKRDVRFGSRKQFHALSNHETITGVLPLTRRRMGHRSRKHFSACGESSTYASSYTNVRVRSLDSLPRMTPGGKESIIGCELPAYGDKVIEAIGKKGHPLFWAEIKEVEMFVATFNDYNVTDVWDCGAGSATAAMAAAICGLRYEGLAMNEKHANFLNNVMDKAMFAIIANRTTEDEEAKKLQSEVLANFSQIIEEARAFLEAPDADPTDDEEVEDGSGHSGEE